MSQRANEEEEEVLDYRQGDRVILQPIKRTWSRRFLDLAGSAPDFRILMSHRSRVRV
jgi:virulence-associated protein VagC